MKIFNKNKAFLRSNYKGIYNASEYIYKRAGNIFVYSLVIIKDEHLNSKFFTHLVYHCMTRENVQFTSGQSDTSQTAVNRLYINALEKNKNFVASMGKMYLPRVL